MKKKSVLPKTQVISELDAKIIQFAKVLYEELDRDSWGDIDSYWIKGLDDFPDPNDPDDNDENVEALREVFQRIFLRLKQDGFKF